MILIEFVDRGVSIYLSNIFMLMENELSIIIPTYNEENTVVTLLRTILSVKLNYVLRKKIYIIDDFSTDKTSAHIENFINRNDNIPIHYLRHHKNLGKGAAIRTGISIAKGNYIIKIGSSILAGFF